MYRWIPFFSIQVSRLYSMLSHFKYMIFPNYRNVKNVSNIDEAMAILKRRTKAIDLKYIMDNSQIKK